MRSSDSIANIAAALVAAQADIKSVHKDRENTHFKNRYATLDTILETVRPVLAKHGLAVVQSATMPHTSDGGTLVAFAVGTRLLHKSGEWLESYAMVPLGKLDPQGSIAALTYGRRGSLSALLALSTEDDDDGESAVAPRQAAPARQPASAPAPRPAAPRPAAPGPQRIDATLQAAVEAMDLEQEHSCPKCGGGMWDNRVGKKNPKAPDFKCKDKACDGVIWPPKTGSAAPAARRANAAPLQSPPDFDAPLPEYEEDGLPF